MRWAVLTGCFLMLPAVALAQPSGGALEQARELFEQGLEAARAERWEQARSLFERSLAAAPVPTTRFNLAAAEIRTGRLLAGVRSYRRFLTEASRGRATRYRDEARTALAEAEARLARVTVVADGLEGNDRVRLDGEEIGGVADEEIEAGPGDHVVTIERGGVEVARERFTVAEGEQRTVTLVPAMLQPAGRGPDPGPGEPPDENGGLFASPVFWSSVGIVVAGAVVLAIILASGTEDPYRGNLGAGMGTFE